MNHIQQRQGIEARLKSLINNTLKDICSAEGLSKTGVKSVLQRRILDHVDMMVQHNRLDDVERIRYRVNHQGHSPPPEAGANTNHAGINRPNTHIPAGTAHMASPYAGRPTLPSINGSRPFGVTGRYKEIFTTACN